MNHCVHRKYLIHSTFFKSYHQFSRFIRNQNVFSRMNMNVFAFLGLTIAYSSPVRFNILVYNPPQEKKYIRKRIQDKSKQKRRVKCCYRARVRKESFAKTNKRHTNNNNIQLHRRKQFQLLQTNLGRLFNYRE